MTLTEVEWKLSSANLSEKVIKKSRTDHRTKEKETIKKDQEKLEPSYTAMRLQMETSLAVPGKVHINSAILFLGIRPSEKTYSIPTPTCTPTFTAALHTTAKKQKQPKCPSTKE